MNIVSTSVIVLVISLVQAKKAYKYPQQTRPRAFRAADYPARLPRNQVANPVQIVNGDTIKPTITSVIVPEESWDATVTEWVSVVDPKQIKTETVTTTITMAKLNLGESEMYDDSYTETEEY